MTNKISSTKSASIPRVRIRKRRLAVRVVMVVASLVTVAHLGATFLWIAPDSAGARSAFPGGERGLKSYMLPFFGQSWSVFAPEPTNGNFHLLVRARTGTGAQMKTTNWLDATAVETSMIKHNLMPPRAGIQAGILASTYKKSWDQLSTRQQRSASLDYTGKGTWKGAYESDLKAQGPSQLAAELVVQEQVVDRYSTQVATAVWGNTVSAVQFRIYRQNVVAYQDRNSPQAVHPAKQYALTGWRALDEAPGQSATAFASVFKNQYEKLTK